ncbi:MAG: hypothetical protein HFF18_07225 [Oscillospiraceae bacterium]|nr:hypothetical protein [Oscillospiraceae bacterium]
MTLFLSGCVRAVPPKAVDGTAWNEDWVTLGNALGVDTPEGLTAQESSDALSAKGMYYATWSIGEAEPHINEDGEDAQLYDAQVYLLAAGYDSTQKAEEAAEEWLAMANEQYAVEETKAETYNGQEFIVITYTYTSESNPYSRGASAFGTYGNYAVSAELSCQEGFEDGALETLENFLDHCHYAA